jgi:acetyl-CoA carboxylase biotin carboxyl carrier protein
MGRAEGTPQLEEVRADLVGGILRVEVTEGDVVTATDCLVILESMKMEIPVCSESGGTVVRVAVEPGDIVQEGDLLVVLK